MKAAAVAILITLVAFVPSGANDTAVTLSAGGLVPAKSSSIVMESEDLTISARQVTVKYLFRNTSKADVELTIAFPLPEIDGSAVANVPINIPSHDPLNFVDFSVLVDGRKVTPKIEILAFDHKGEITSKLRGLGLPLSALEDINGAVRKLSPLQRHWKRAGFSNALQGTTGSAGHIGRAASRSIGPSDFRRGRRADSAHIPAGGGRIGDLRKRFG